jgi:hypothetical protein
MYIYIYVVSSVYTWLEISKFGHSSMWLRFLQPPESRWTINRVTSHWRISPRIPSQNISQNVLNKHQSMIPSMIQNICSLMFVYLWKIMGFLWDISLFVPYHYGFWCPTAAGIIFRINLTSFDAFDTECPAENGQFQRCSKRGNYGCMHTDRQTDTQMDRCTYIYV